MKYVSTRGKTPAMGFETTLLEGFAADGGLFVPENVPCVDWLSWRHLNYEGIVKKLLEHFTNDTSTPFSALVDRAFETDFQTEESVKVTQLDSGVSVLELFHGPTWAFKDYALGVIGELQQFYLEKRNIRQIAVVATSGDTGSAAMNAVKGKANIDIIVLYPQNRISSVQELQLTAYSSYENVHVFSVDGSSDELDDVIRELFAEEHFTGSHNLTSYNSIQWARVLIQMAHWFYGYFSVTSSDQEQLAVAVPCGAAGNLTAGLYAKQMGLPISIVACTGKNDAVCEAIKHGKLVKKPVEQSLANAMDIQVPYNMERILYLLCENDRERSELSNLMEHYYGQKDAVTLPVTLQSAVLKTLGCHCADDKEIIATIQWSVNGWRYIPCPHTATALSYARNHKNARPILCIATAAPEKFPDVFSLSGLSKGTFTNYQSRDF